GTDQSAYLTKMLPLEVDRSISSSADLDVSTSICVRPLLALASTRYGPEPLGTRTSMRPLLVRARTESGASANETSMRPLLVRRSTDGLVTPHPVMAPFEVWRTTVSAVTRCISIRPLDVERSTGPSTSTRRMAPLSVEPSSLVPGGTLIR